MSTRGERLDDSAAAAATDAGAQLGGDEEQATEESPTVNPEQTIAESPQPSVSAQFEGNLPGATSNLRILQRMRKFNADNAAKQVAELLPIVQKLEEAVKTANNPPHSSMHWNEIARLVDGAVDCVRKAAAELASRTAELSAAAAEGHEEHHSLTKVAQLTVAATTDLLCVLRAAQEVTKLTSDAASRDIAGREKLLRTGRNLLTSFVTAAVAIARETSELADTAGREQSDERGANCSGVIIRTKKALLDELLKYWSEDSLELVRETAAAAQQTAIKARETDRLTQLEPAAATDKLQHATEQTVQAAREAEAALKLAADSAKLFELAAEHGLLEQFGDPIKAVVTTVAEQLPAASSMTAELAYTAAIKAAGKSRKSCVRAINSASRAAEAAMRIAWLSLEAAKAVPNDASRPCCEADPGGAADLAKVEAAEIKKLLIFDEVTDSEVDLTPKASKTISGLGLLLLLTAIALVAEIRSGEMCSGNTTVAVNNSMTNQTKLYRAVCGDCIAVQAFRCLLYLLGIVSLVGLECILRKSIRFRVGLVGATRIPMPAPSVDAPPDFCLLPSPLLILAFLVFSIPNWLSMVIEVICGVAELGGQDCYSRDLTAHGITMIVRRSIALAFSLLQSRFFFKYFQKSIQQRLGLSWLFLSVLLAVNIGVWFTTVGLELHDISGGDKVIPECSFCSNSTVVVINDLLYPFQIEYCVMSSLLAVLMMSNLARMARSLSREAFPSETIVAIIQGRSHGPKKHGKEFSLTEITAAQKHSVTFLLGLIVILTALFVISFVRFDAHGGVSRELSILFTSVLLGMRSVSVLPCAVLFCYINWKSMKPINFNHLIDRFLLLLGVAAILLNCIYSFWKSASAIPTAAEEDRIVIGLSMSSSLLVIIQSSLQSAIIELILISQLSCNNWLHNFSVGLIENFRQFVCCRWTGSYRRLNEEGAEEPPKPNGRSVCQAILNLLILMNAAEWLLSALCFLLFFPKEEDKTDWVTLLLLPLLVFYRFHSAVCIFEFKDYLIVDSDDATGDNHPGEEASERLLVGEQDHN